MHLRELTVSDLPAATELSRAVQWPHRLEDWQFALALGQGLAAVVGDRLVGTVLWWTYERAIARVGLVLVDPNMQRAGIGHALMAAALERLETTAVVLNATEVGAPLYRKLGFLGFGAILQHQGVVSSAMGGLRQQAEKIRPLARTEMARVIALDASASGVQRPRVIETVFAEAEGVALSEAGKIVGFAFCRRFGKGLVIGPVVAHDAAMAKALIAHWIASNTGQFVRIDVPADAGLSAWLDELGLTRCAPVQTMCRGMLPAPSGPLRTFALVTQALG